jgi:serine acetyltransferase
VFWSTVYKVCPGIAVRFGSYLAKVLVKCDLQASTQVGDGVFLSNYGHLVLGARSIGSGTIIHERVTIGMDLMGGNVPEIGRNVWIGPDCVIYGEIAVGDGATVLPGTVLTKSIPPGSVVQGNPARIIKRHFENSGLRASLSTNCDSFFGREPLTTEGQDV